MRKFLIAAVAVSGLFLSSAAFAEHEKDGKKDDKGWSGTLIDKACSANMKSDKEAMAHTKKCATKEGCAKSGYGLFHDDKFIAFDDKGNEAAAKYLKDDKHGLAIHVTGELAKDGKSIKVDEIHPDKKADKKADGDKKDDDKKDSK